MSSERLARLVDFGAFNDMDSVLVTRHGRIVLEATYAPFRAGLKHHVYSATKSVDQHPGRHGGGRRPARQHRPAGRGFLPRPHDRQPRRRQEGDHGPAAARHDIGPHLAGGPERRQRLQHRHGAQSRLAAIRPRPTDGDRAGHALLLQQRQQPSAVGHPEQGHGQERQRLCAGKAVPAARHRRRAVAGRPAGPLGRRLGPPPAAARHGEDRLSLAARRPVGGQADPAGGVDRGRTRRRRRHARELGKRPALRPPVLGDAAARHLHGGRQTPPAHRRDAQARHRGGGDRLAALCQPERQHGQHAALQLRDAGGLPRRRRDLRRSRRGQCPRRRPSSPSG